MRSECRRGGFTLVEVSIALLMIGLGLLSVFSLFPAGLKLAEEDVADTRAGLFAETVLSGMRGNAMSVTNWSQWDNPSMAVLLKEDVLPPGASVVDGSVQGCEFPPGSLEYLRYRLTMSTTNAARYSAKLEVENGQYPEGAFIRTNVFYTEFYYQGK
jgi:prepilin-type N-terminal cleavage/methylation domain-containing protein